MFFFVENSTVWIEKSLASLLVVWGRDVWLGNAPDARLRAFFWSMETPGLLRNFEGRTQDQADCKGVKNEGHFKGEHYRY